MRQTEIDAAIKALADSKGRVTPQAVVQAARAKNHPLHGCFEWDVKKAAQLHWEETASSLIRSVKLRETVADRVIIAPFYVRDPDRSRNEKGYRALQSVRTESEAAHEVLVDEMTLVSSILARAKSVAAVLAVDGRVGEIEAKVSEFVADLTEQPSAEA